MVAQVTAPVLPGSLVDLLTVGMVVHRDADWLHTEHDPDVWRTPSGIIHTIGNETLGVVAVGVRGRPDGMVIDEIAVDRIHQCDDDTCLYRPAVARPADVRYAARWLLRIVGERSGRLTDHDRRLIAVAVTLHMKAIA